MIKEYIVRDIGFIDFDTEIKGYTTVGWNVHTAQFYDGAEDQTYVRVLLERIMVPSRKVPGTMRTNNDAT